MVNVSSYGLGLKISAIFFNILPRINIRYIYDDLVIFLVVSSSKIVLYLTVFILGVKLYLSKILSTTFSNNLRVVLSCSIASNV